MKNALIIHGTGGYPEENWFPWMKKQLEGIGYEVNVPAFPTPEGQTLEAWLEVVAPYEKNFNEETILIGHSFGGTFVLRILEKIPVKIKLAALVATPCGVMPVKYFETDKLFVGEGFDWGKIRVAAEKFLVFHSDNDPFVGLGNAEKIAQGLGVDVTLVKGAGHFNKAAGYTEFKELVDRIAE